MLMGDVRYLAGGTATQEVAGGVRRFDAAAPLQTEL
jgi:hypothetical protein